MEQPKLKDLRVPYYPKIGDIMHFERMVAKTVEPSEPAPTSAEILSLWEQGRQLYAQVKVTWSDGSVSFEDAIVIIAATSEAVQKNMGVLKKMWNWLAGLFH